MVSAHVKGVPCTKNKVVGDKAAARRWTDAVLEQTRHLPRVAAPCLMRVTFYLLKNKGPSDCPHGNDLDNLLNRFNDALARTVLSEAPGKDSAIWVLEANKEFVDSEQEAGASFELHPLASVPVAGVPEGAVVGEGMKPSDSRSARRRPAKADSLGWPEGYFERTAGSLAGVDLVRPPQGKFEERLPLG